MKLTLGIDAGGTYTDAVLLDPVSGQVWRKAKALTTPHDLSIGVAGAIANLEGVRFSDVKLVSLSTTLATNAIVEGHGDQVGLLLIGYDQEIMQRSGLEERLPVEEMYYLAGGHDVKGDEVCSLDREAAHQAILNLRDRVDAFAVSGYFSVMNPDHELQVRRMIKALTDAPVVCGHELSSKLNSLKRVTTTVLNARLLPVIQHLLDSVKRALVERGITAPLMVVTGAGSLISEEMARQRPVETILSGPAASAIGGQYLAGEDSAVVVDMGGTTTDIAILEGGQPWKNPAGATVGGWQTSVQATDLRTIGIGGDSHIRVERGKKLLVGPRRAIPLCRLGVKWPNIVRELEGAIHAGAGHRSTEPTDFMTITPWTQQERLTNAEEALLAALAHGPVSIAHLCRILKRRDIPGDRLEALGVLRRAGLTPTDLLLVASGSTEMPGSLGMTVNVDAARAGAQVIARQLDLTVDELIHRVIEYVVDRVTREILDKLVTDATGHGLFPTQHGWEFVLEMMLRQGEEGTMSCQMQLRKPIVAIGAPVASFIPQVADKLHTRCLIPTHAEVGNAVGAVVASITHTVEILVQPNLVGAGTVAYLVHSPHDREVYNLYSEAVARAEEIAVSVAQETVRRAGADAITLKVDRQEVALGKLSEMTVRATASGRPRIGE